MLQRGPGHDAPGEPGDLRQVFPKLEAVWSSPRGGPGVTVDWDMQVLAGLVERLIQPLFAACALPRWPCRDGRRVRMPGRGPGVPRPATVTSIGPFCRRTQSPQRGGGVVAQLTLRGPTASLGSPSRGCARPRQRSDQIHAPMAAPQPRPCGSDARPHAFRPEARVSKLAPTSRPRVAWPAIASTARSPRSRPAAFRSTSTPPHHGSTRTNRPVPPATSFDTAETATRIERNAACIRTPSRHQPPFARPLHRLGTEPQHTPHNPRSLRHDGRPSRPSRR